MLLEIYEKCNADKGCRDRWKRWASHRHIINSILTEKIFINTKIKDAVILGAGRCEDIDLKFLLNNVDSLTLVDYDYNSIKNALDRQQLSFEEKKKIILKGNIEFTGFYEEDFLNEIIAKIKIKEDSKTIKQYIMDYLIIAKSNIKEMLDNKEYSLVICGAVHSQLIVPFMQIVEIDSGLSNELKSKIIDIANVLAENYNKSLLSLTKEKGWLFTFFDVMELSEKNYTLQYESIIANLINRGEYKEIDEIMLKKGGVVGSRHAYQHLNKLVENYNPSQRSWIWQFKDNKKYYIRSLCFRKS